MEKQKLKRDISGKKLYTPHQKYLLGERNKRIKIRVWQIGLLIAFFGLWELSTSLGWVDSFFFSSPSRIVKMFIELCGDKLFYHAGITLMECIIGFAVSTILGIAVALLLWLSVSARKVSQPYLIVLNALPKVALGPLILIWVGVGIQATVFMTVLICLIVTIMTVLEGFVSTDENKLLLMRSMGASKLEQLRYVVLPASLPTLMSVFKVNIGLAWVGTIMGEYLTSSAGLGYLIIYGGQVFNINLVMTSIVVLCVLAALMYGVVALLEKIFIRHR